MMAKNFLQIASLLLCLLCELAVAQPQTFSDPLKLAQIAIGDEQGSVAVGVLQGSASQFAFFYRSGKSALVATAADGSALSTPHKAADEQLFEIGSITKVFTGYLLAKAVENGDLALDDTLGKLLAGTVNFQSPATAAITLKQLVTHSSCLPRAPTAIKESLFAENPYAAWTRDEMWMDLSTRKLETSTPCVAAYSNFGMALLGEILSHHYKKPWIDLIKTQITEPLGMKDTVQILGLKTPRLAQGYSHLAKINGWEFKAMAGAGALRSTASDMLIFSRAMMAGRTGLLGAASERMLQPLGQFQNSQIGYAVFIRGPESKRTYMHDGLTGGYRAQWMISPSTKEAVIALVSNSHAPISRMHALLLAGLYPNTVQPSSNSSSKINDYVGVFRIDKSSAVSFVMQDANLYRRFTGGGYRALQPAGEDVFIDQDFSVQYVFQRTNGAIASVRYLQGGGEFIAPKTAEPVHTLAVADAVLAKEYTGRYILERSLRNIIDFDVKEEGGQLLVRSSNFLRQPIFPKPGQKDRFFYDAPTTIEIQFERDALGKVIALTLFEGREFKLQKILN
jgi:serine-type D-Ala-D-Ala carboxypeptidase/endopeptidase